MIVYFWARQNRKAEVDNVKQWQVVDTKAWEIEREKVNQSFFERLFLTKLAKAKWEDQERGLKEQG
jgi:hypothetical protein